MKTRSQLIKDKRITRNMNNKIPYLQISCNHKSRKLNGKKSIRWQRGRRRRRRSLDDCPDAILCHILSFLPTRPAVRTSVLSKRWRYLWTSLPSLDFRERIHYHKIDEITSRRNFTDFVERVISLHNAPRIQNFSLRCDLKGDAALINKWISTVMGRHPQEFDICLFYSRDENDQNVLPHCLFTCQTLQVLKVNVHFTLQIPSQICLPNLKKLTLQHVTLKDDHTLNILFASPALKELVIDNCIWKVDRPAAQLIISSPALKELVIDKYRWEVDRPVQLIILAPKLQSLIIKEDSEEFTDASASVTISSPLKTFSYSGAFTKEYQLTCSSSIVMATIDFFPYTSMDDINLDRFHKVLRSIRFVKQLNIGSYAIEGLSHARVPTFTNLISLVFFEVDEHGCYEGLEKFLNKCPRLETLKLSADVIKELDIKYLLRPDCKCLSSLKKITVIELCGNTEELVGLHVMLAKATSLENMVIDLRLADVSARKKIKTFLSGISMGSESCKLNYI